MTILRNNQMNDASMDEASNQTTFAVGVLTALAVAAILLFASTG
ncbi:MAG TPA: hypothetical protein VKG24_27125 [Pseudolabrys sp.]|jgi:hypothetical protein|nr:hypothetical protein [Pseudolabrys sp.]